MKCNLKHIAFFELISRKVNLKYTIQIMILLNVFKYYVGLMLAVNHHAVGSDVD